MKRVLSIVLSLLFIVTLIPVTNLKASALDSRVEAAIKWAVNIANDNSHGYSQAKRNGPDYDCSSLVSTAFKMGGFPVSGSLNTSSMSTPFMNAGFKRYKKGAVTIRRGDILLKPGSHVELYLGDSTCVGAHSNYDGKTGDSSGKEIAVRNVSKCSFCRNKGYTYVLRYEGGSSSTTTPSTPSTSTPAPATPKYKFSYNANGGKMAETVEFTLEKGDEVQVANPSCSRSGYTCVGWTAKRNTDSKWYVDGKGWCTESQITDGGYSKMIYDNYEIVSINDAWIKGLSGDGAYTFYAVWEEGEVIRGDMTMNGVVDMEDAIHLMLNISFPEFYPVDQPADFDGNDVVDLDDAIYFIFHVNFPEEYPID